MLKLCKLLPKTIFSEAEKRAKPSHLERRNRLNSHKMNPENHLTNNLIVKLQFIELASLSYLYLSSLKHNTTNTLIIKKRFSFVLRYFLGILVFLIYRRPKLILYETNQHALYASFTRKLYCVL